MSAVGAGPVVPLGVDDAGAGGRTLDRLRRPRDRPGVALEDLAGHARRPDHARLGKLGERVGEVVRIGGFVAVGGTLEPHGVLHALHGIVGPDHPGSRALVVLVLAGLARRGAVTERGAPGPPGLRDDPLVLPGDERSDRLRSGGHHLPPEGHRRDAAVSAACRPHALRHLARPGAGHGRRRRERKAGSRRRRLGGEDLLKEALDGALRRGQPRERWALGEGDPPGRAEIRHEAGEARGDRRVEGDRLGQEVEVPLERIGPRRRRLARRVAGRARRLLDRQEPVGGERVRLAIGGVQRPREPDVRAVGRGGGGPCPQVARRASREPRQPDGRRRDVGGQQGRRPGVERAQEELEPLPDPGEGQPGPLARGRDAPPEVARGGRRQARAFDQEAFGLRHRGRYSTAAITS